MELVSFPFKHRILTEYVLCGRHMRNGQGSKGLGSYLQKTYHVMGYMKENSKKVENIYI